MRPFLLLAIIYLAFTSLGLPDSVLGVAWPSMRASLGSPLEAAGLIAITLTGCSALSSVLSGWLNQRLGTGLVVLASCVLTSLGLLGYAASPSLLWLFAAALPLGFGQGAVDASLNGYVAHHYASRHMNWLHASWGIGATLGPALMTGMIAGELGWRHGYQLLATVQGALALLFLATLRLWKHDPSAAHAPEAGNGVEPPRSGSIQGMRHPEPWIQIGMYALYAAAEFGVGIWTASLLIESRALAPRTAGSWVALYYGGITVGRVLTGLIADRVGNRAMVRIGLALALSGALCLCVRAPVWMALPGLVLLGLGFAPVYPCLMHETPRRFHSRTYQAVIGFQVGAACVGGAVLPALLGVVAAATSLEIIAPAIAGGIVVLALLGERLNRTT